MARKTGFSTTEQWLVLGVPVALLFGYLFLTSKAQAKQQSGGKTISPTPILTQGFAGPAGPAHYHRVTLPSGQTITTHKDYLQGLIPYDMATIEQMNAPGNAPFR